MSRFRGAGRSGGARVEMGEAISFEDVLTVITVLLLLRLVFMVPLVNLDKAKTIVNTAWIRKPADGVVDASASCKCAGNTHACNSTCGQTIN